MFVVFEGIDGGGKTTLSNLVAQRLRDSGLVVQHVREGGTFASRVTQSMRELGRDARNLALSPRAELMLYLTREVQLFDEATRPALSTADIVIADRFVATAEVLAIHGRGMLASEVRPLVTAATGGIVPDLTILVDVDPRIARARRQVSKIATGDSKPPSRKGLAGTALQLRLREGYRELAHREPDRWIIVDNTDADLAEMAATIATAIGHARQGGAASARAHVASVWPPHAVGAATFEAARAALVAWIDRRAVTEPGLAAYFLDGLSGPEFDERRIALASRAPRIIAAGLAGQVDPVSWELRHTLVATAAENVAWSLIPPAATHPAAAPLLQTLAVTSAVAVGEVLQGRDDDLAWEVRARLPLDAALVSLGRVAGPAGWRIREQWLAERGGVDAIDDVAEGARLCRSVVGLPDPRAWEIRRALRGIVPVAALASIEGLTDERAWKWRERHLERAPKVIMKTLVGLDEPRAWTLRNRVAATCEEVLDTITGMDTSPAWALREQLADLYPPSVIKSVGVLSATERGHALVARILARHATDVAVWRQALLHS